MTQLVSKWTFMLLNLLEGCLQGAVDTTLASGTSMTTSNLPSPTLAKLLQEGEGGTRVLPRIITVSPAVDGVVASHVNVSPQTTYAVWVYRSKSAFDAEREKAPKRTFKEGWRVKRLKSHPKFKR